MRSVLRGPRPFLVLIICVIILAVIFGLPGDDDPSPGPSLSLGAGPAVGPAAAGPVECDRVATPEVRRVRRFVDRLEHGQTGCFRAGTYRFSKRLKMTTPRVTLSSYPGERATLAGRIWVAKRATGAGFVSLDLDGGNAQNLPSPTITAKDTVWRDLDVTNGHDRTICFHLGSGGYGNAERTLIEGSRIHDCGRLPPANHHHGIYVLHADDSVIRENAIYGNADRAVNLYPNARDVLIADNVIDGNGEGIMFAGNGASASSGNVATGNIISNSRVRWNVESYWPQDIGTGNAAHGNCLFASNPSSPAYNENGGVKPPVGFTAFDNLIADPLFVNRAAGDFRLRSGSPCQGYGPAG